MTAVDEVIDAFHAAGWTVASERVGRGPNPTRLDLKRGRRQGLALLVYAWKITGEGAGRTGTNFRIQTTRTHDGPLLSELHRLTLGFGIDADRGVIAAFDGWTKRNTGGSSSVHIKRNLLDTAAEAGFATDGHPWDSRAAARLGEIDQLLPWIYGQLRTRETAVPAVDFQWHGDAATATADLWDSATAAWLRTGDRLVLADKAGEHLLDSSIWTVKSVAVTVTSEAGKRYPRRAVSFALKRYGRVKNEAEVLAVLTGGQA